ncbi:MAG: transporter substrate-binding domain-containing protein [Methylocystaceae bacterium]|nr:transporter substrate-binding domain-containing protein [Methylocystaceae bacterium]
MIRAFVFLLFILVWGVTQSRATEVNIKVGFSYFPPWQLSKNEQFKGGIDKLVLDALIAEMAKTHQIVITPSFYYCPLKRCLAMLEAGALDLKTALLRRADRETYLHYIEPTYQEFVNQAVYVHPHQARLINNYEDLTSLRIGVSRAAKNFKRFDQDDRIQKIETRGTFNGLKMLKAGRFDAFLGTELVVDYILAIRPEFEGIKKSGFVKVERNPGYFVMSKKSVLMSYQEELNQSMKKIVGNGVVGKAVSQVFKAH